LHGARQVGKTWLLHYFGRENFKAYHYFNFEKRPDLSAAFDRDLEPRRILQSLSFAGDTTIGPDDLVVFDEIQQCPKALTSLKYFSEDLPEQPVCAAGSLLGLHYGNTDAYPVGKTTSIDMHPMDFEEFCWALDDERASGFLATINGEGAHKAFGRLDQIIHRHLWALYQQYLITGGLPEIVGIFSGARSDARSAGVQVRERQSELIDDYIADMAKHAGKINALHIERVFRAIPAQLARETHRFQFKNIIPGKNGYAPLAGPIDWLTAAGIVIKSSIANQAQVPVSAYTKENIFTLFVFDVGILGALAGIPPQSIAAYDYGWFKGTFAENAAAVAFQAAGCGALFSWSEGIAEIEFIMEIDGKIVPVEVKAGINTKAKSLTAFRRKYQPAISVIMSAAPPPEQRKEGVLYIPLYLAGKLMEIVRSAQLEPADGIAASGFTTGNSIPQ
jgi:hypothetical protein